MREDVSFTVAKQRTHRRLMEMLQNASHDRTALLLDSTNGLKSAREAYCEVFNSGRLIYLVLRPPSEDFIIMRIRQREGNAETPEHERLVGLGGLRPDASDNEIRDKVS